MHVTDGKNVNQKGNESNKQHIDTTEPIHRETKIRAKRTYLYPRPKMIEERTS